MLRYLALVLVVLPGAVWSQTINVRSGAHEGFARLVLDARPGTQWDIENLERGARLTIPGHTSGFDTSRVFDKIDRSFVSSVSADETSITLEFACDCVTDVFSEGPRMIVIDVSVEPQTTAATTVDPDVDLALRFVGSQELRFEASTSESARPFSVISQSTTEKDAISVSDFEQQTVESQTPSNILLDDSNTARLQQTQQNLLEGISRAATRGILKHSNQNVELPTIRQKPQVDVSIFDSSATPALPQNIETAIGGNLRVTTSSDIPSTGDDDFLTSTTLGVRCIDPALVAVQDWQADTGFVRKIATLRSTLFSEFDRLDENTAIELARTYLHYGFGAEAEQVLFINTDLAQSNKPLIGLARIMEYGHSLNADYLSNFVDCDTDVALWAILAMESIDPSRTINTKAALRALSALPMHLRSFIAPELSRRILEYGDETGAAAALRSLERTAVPLTPDANLAKADLEMSQGAVDQAQQRLADVVTSNAEQSAEALVKFVESHLDADDEIDADVATLVEAYAIEMRDDPIGADLRKAHVVALGKSGQFSAAFDALSRVRARDADAQDGTLRSLILETLTKKADDAEFLDHAFEQMVTAPETISPKVRFHLAQRLSALGFPEQAETILTTSPQPVGTSEVRLLKAQISLDLARPQEALAHLYGLNMEEADRLRATAKTQIGDFDAAHSIFSEAGDREGAQRTAWLARNWSELMEEEAPVFGAVSRVAKNELEDPLELDGMLSRAAAAISESADAREIIENLLQSEALGEGSGEGFVN
ncbi:hypothetical protein [Tateyamaria sp. SN3-11]|uniref:hypothetical protein n=1 Tax=Tateyamaria sp. SN3-11 TaxID=3092147 RepID=UPI0039E92BF7